VLLHEGRCRLSAATADVVEAQMNPWTFVRCRVAGKHRWEAVGGGDDLDSGWRCRDCHELVIKRDLVERDYAQEPPSSPYWGKQDPRP
jgi:hypothetical protein